MPAKELTISDVPFINSVFITLALKRWMQPLTIRWVSQKYVQQRPTGQLVQVSPQNMCIFNNLQVNMSQFFCLKNITLGTRYLRIPSTIEVGVSSSQYHFVFFFTDC